MSEIITCFCLADFEDEDYVPDSDDDISEDDLNFMRNTDYHAEFQAYKYDNSNDHEDPDIIYRVWWEEIIKQYLRKGCIEGQVSTVRIQ